MSFSPMPSQVIRSCVRKADKECVNVFVSLSFQFLWKIRFLHLSILRLFGGYYNALSRLSLSNSLLTFVQFLVVYNVTKFCVIYHTSVYKTLEQRWPTCGPRCDLYRGRGTWSLLFVIITLLLDPKSIQIYLNPSQVYCVLY